MPEKHRIDFGNNHNTRDNLALYFVEEPDPYTQCSAQTLRRVPIEFPGQKTD